MQDKEASLQGEGGDVPNWDASVFMPKRFHDSIGEVRDEGLEVEVSVTNQPVHGRAIFLLATASHERLVDDIALEGTLRTVGVCQLAPKYLA
ncbi:hypothetical protein UW163_15645 [Ralstonia solanacearum]|nr:hypothetical protein UW163_15645 [Ralstonia solanacearum]